MSKPKALVTAAYSEEGLAFLREHYDVEYHNWMEQGRAFSEDELLDMVEDKELIIVEVCDLHKKVVDKAKNVKIVGCCRGLRGDDNTLDVPALTERKIPVLFAPGRNLNAVAEYTIMLTLAAMKKAKASTKWLNANNWKSWLDFYITFRTAELQGKRVGILGFGNIGKRVAKLFNAFEADVVAYDPFITDEKVYEERNVKMVDLETLLKTSDVITLHMNVSDDSKGFIGKDELAMMKDGAFLINSARAVLVDHDALLDAIKNKKLGGVAMDVFYSEPATTENEPLLAFDNVFATPHMAGTTNDVIVNHSRMINDGIKALQNNEKPAFVLNPEVL